MKKVFITIMASLAISTSVMAAGHVDSVRYMTTKAWKNWYISADATCNWWQGSMRTPEGFINSYTAVEWGKPTIGFNAYVGKWINHKVGVRFGYTNNKINSYIYGRHIGLAHLQWLYGDEPELVEAYHGDEIYRTSMFYHKLQADFMFSPIDFFQGYYNERRVWTPVLYVGMGAAYTTKDFFAIKTWADNGKAKKDDTDDLEPTGNNFELCGGAGLINNFRLSKHFDINLELAWTMQRYSIDSWGHEFEQNATVRSKRFDNMYTAAIGLAYHFTREYDLPVNCCKEMDSIKKKLDEFVCPDPEPEQNPCDTVVKFVNVQSEDILSYPFSIFFNRDSYELMSRRDVINLREIANVAKENGYKLRLTGSCDSATASPSYNQTLSENRCNKIKMELLELGVPEDQIIIEPIGGVKQLDPTEYDRRVLIQLVKEAE
jgi:outer membrane protein OmpA-like peptidoglycan-associated protein